MTLSLLAAFAVAAPPPFEENLHRGRAFLFRELPRGPAQGESAASILSFGTYALLKTAPLDRQGRVEAEPVLRSLLDRVRKEAAAVERADWTNSHWGTYGQAALVMCLCADDPVRDKAALDALVARLLKAQLPSGAWGYPKSATADTSQTQFVALALWEAARCGFAVPPATWDNMLHFQLVTQSAAGAGAGGFAYNPTVPPNGAPVGQAVSTSMTVAGLSTMLVAREFLPTLRTRRPHQGFGDFVRPQENDAPAPFRPKCDHERVEAAINAAEKLLRQLEDYGLKGKLATPGREIYFCYGAERVAALSDGRLGKAWDTLAPFVASRQKPAGHWDGLDGPLPETAMALLMLGRVTAKRLEPVQGLSLLGRAHAVGGEGMPGAASNALARQAERFHGGPASAVAGTRAAPENFDGREFQASAAMPPETEGAALARVRAAGANLAALWSQADDGRPTVRAAALAALAATRDFRAAPALHRALGTADDAVYAAARDGLRRLSRDPESFGLPAPRGRTAAAVNAASARVRGWIDGLRLELPPAFAFAAPPR